MFISNYRQLVLTLYYGTVFMYLIRTNCPFSWQDRTDWFKQCKWGQNLGQFVEDKNNNKWWQFEDKLRKFNSFPPRTVRLSVPLGSSLVHKPVRNYGLPKYIVLWSFRSMVQNKGTVHQFTFNNHCMTVQNWNQEMNSMYCFFPHNPFQKLNNLLC